MTGREETNRKIELFLDEWAKSAPAIVQEYKESFPEDKTKMTKKQYLIYVKEFVDYFGEDKVFELKPKDIVIYLKHIQKKPDGTNNSASICGAKFYAISDFYNFLEDNEYVNKNICKKVKAPKITETKNIVAMTPNEVSHMKDNIENGVGNARAVGRQRNWKSRDKAIITLGCQTGLRVTSITEINISDIDFDRNIIHVTEKGNKHRDVVIGSKTKEIIKEWINDRQNLMKGHDDVDALFISNQRTRITSKSISRIVAKYTSDIDKHITPHKMRSTCATNLYQKTGDIYLVQNVLGHSNIQNTRRYAAVSNENLANAAGIMDNLY